MVPEGDLKRLLADLKGARLSDGILCYGFTGNEHNVFGIVSSGRSFEQRKIALEEKVAEGYRAWCGMFQPIASAAARTIMVLPPPPCDNDWVARYPGVFRRRLAEQPICDPCERLELYATQCNVIRKVAREFDIDVVELPASVFSESGFLAEDCRAEENPTHGNAKFGRRVLETIIGPVDSACAAGDEAKPGMVATGRKLEHPYSDLPDSAFWKHGVTQAAAHELDPVVDVPFTISLADRVATAGSCFAQHISKRLSQGGFRFMQMESAHGVSADAPGYDFSARYGNIYTARQLLQLFDRAFGYFKPIDQVWERVEGGFCDPFRPRIEPHGYASKEAVAQATRRHLAFVRKMFRQLDVFVFTLGLTECWSSRLDGAVYPLAPGVAGGIFDRKKHEFLNFSAAEVRADLDIFLRRLRLVNPKAKMILTVSPVPLVATAAGRHVLVATTYSKSVLRVAADEIAASHKGVFYFPSYEIITGSHARGRYYADDGRSITEAGVDHVMRVFMSRATALGGEPVVACSPLDQNPYAEMEALAEADCDEEMLQR